MRVSFRVCKIAGLDIHIHLSLLIIIVLLTYAFYASQPPLGFSDFKNPTKIVLASIAAISIFVAILLHELAHSFIAMHYGIKVREIILFIFGGLAIMETLPKDPKKEFFISIAGPLMSIALACTGLILSYIPIEEISAFFKLFGYFNMILAIFNLIPAFPMDGGRILRSILAEKIGYVKATKTAAEIGKALAIFMGVIGLFYSPWLILIAFFIYIGAGEEERMVTIENVLGKFKVKDIMSTEIVTVSPEATVKELLELMLKKKHLGYPVVENDKLVGIVTLKDVIRADPSQKIKEVMSRDVVTISPDAKAFDALKVMSERRIGRIPVTENSKLVGIISRSDLMKVTEILEVLEVLGWKRG